LVKLKSKLVREQHIFKAAVHKKKLKKKLENSYYSSYIQVQFGPLEDSFLLY
jgi:hypothetical protein